MYRKRRTLLSTVLSVVQRCKLAAILSGDYRIICVVRGSDGELEGLGYTANGNAVLYDDIWTVEQAREAMEQGHRLYTLSPSGGYGEIELSGDRIRARSDHEDGNQLDDLPACS